MRWEAARRGLLFAPIVLGTLLVAAAAPIEAPSAWLQFRLNGTGNAVVPGTMQVAWRKTTGRTYSSSPTLVDGVLYIGDNGGTVYALDPATGRTEWSHRLEDAVMSAPIVSGDLLFVGEGNANSAPGASPSNAIHVGDGHNALVALDRRTGAVRWTIPLAGSGMPTAAIVGGVLVHHDGGGDVVGLDPLTGRTLYKRNLHSLASMVAALPFGADAFVTSGVGVNAVWMLRARDGATIWQSNFSPAASAIGDCPPVTDGKRIYCNYIMPPSVATPVETGSMATERAYALDASTGRKLWDVPVESGILPKRNEAAIPLLAGGTLFFGSAIAPAMHALDPATGRLKWRLATHGPVKGGVIYADGAIYFGDLAGYLWAVNARTGAVIGDERMGTPFNVGSPILAGQTLIIGSRGGTIVAVPLARIRAAHDR